MHARATHPIGEAKILLPPGIQRDSLIYVRTLISHPMDTGFFKDHAGKPIPAHFIDAVTVTYGGEEVARFTWTSGISRDPFLTFPLRATREAPLAVTWRDNRGGVYRQSVDVAFS
ncbi:MAG TPA: thiosulfate oxidation carrier complex protein SoxZ [Gemmatimonadota bacterium]|jgi:sulfur-oxidizing protein SoxZ